MIEFFKELRRRNVYKVATVYAITAWLLAQIINLAADAFGAPDWVMQMVIILLLGGFPIALILAWAFELTPEGFRRTTAQDNNNATKSPSRTRFNMWIIGLLVVALLFLGLERIFFAESTVWKDDLEVDQASIAVLPFADFSPKGDQEYFADGISDEILNSLAQVKGLLVAGRTSSFQFKNENRDLKEIGAKLGVSHILQGSVRKSGDQLRITAQLIKIEDGFHIWSNTYDRPYSAENIFEVQDEISREVLEELKVRLLPSDEISSHSRPTENLEAYNLYLKGNAEAADLHADGLERAVQYFDAATKKDPDFALAYAKKAEAIMFQYMFGNLDYEKMMENAREAIDWALVKKQELAEAYSVLGWYHYLNHDKNKALLALEKAKELKPGDAEIRSYYGMMLWQQNSIKKAKEELEYAYKLNPMSSLMNLYMGEMAEHSQDYQKAEDYFKRAIELRPHLLPAYEALSNLYGANLGRHDKAIITMHTAKKKVSKKTPSINIIFYPATDLKLFGLAEKQLNELKRFFPYNPATFNAEIYWLMNHAKYQDIIEKLETIDSLDQNMPVQVYLSRYSLPALATEQYLPFIKKIEKKDPDLFSTDTANYKNRTFGNIVAGAVALRETGKRAKADSLVHQLQDYLDQFPEDQIHDFEGKYSFDYLLCKAYFGDKDHVKNYFHERLESKNTIAHSLIFGIYNELFFHLSEEELAPFKTAEEKIIKDQRKNVIAYLKKEGDWQEEWVQ